MWFVKKILFRHYTDIMSRLAILFSKISYLTKLTYFKLKTEIN